MSKSVDVIDSCLDASFKSMEKHLTQVADDRYNVRTTILYDLLSLLSKN